MSRCRFGPTALIALGLFLEAPGWSAADETVALDKEVLIKANVGTEPTRLLELIRKRIPSEAEQRMLETLVRQLGSEQFKVREEAESKLVAVGPLALASLRAALKQSDLEVVRRANECIKKISAGNGPAVSMAAVRLLVHQPPAETLPLLFEFFPFAEDEQVEEEVLKGLTLLGLRGGKVEPALAAAVKDPSVAPRAAAAFVFGRAGTPQHRATVRQLLEDADAAVRFQAARGLLGDRVLRGDGEEAAADEKVLKEVKLDTDAASLLAFFRKRTLSEADRRQLEAMIQQLGHDEYLMREEAGARLLDRGPSALPYLRSALLDRDLEVARRAERCIAEINRGPGPLLTAAAVRVLVRQRLPDAIPVLLGYVPFADDDSVEDEIMHGLSALCVHYLKATRELSAALKDPLPARRALAAFVLGQIGDVEQCAAVSLLLSDAEARVRFRAAQGLLSAKDKSVVPVLLTLLAEAPLDLAWQVEEVLQRVAREQAPALSISDASAEGRRKSLEAWSAWWREQGPQVDLVRLEQGPRHLGLTLVAELDSNRVWECARDGRPRWQIQNLQGPIDAQALPGGRVLIAEHQGQRVTERDLKGNILWEKRVTGNPIACQRLPNGNTFIATYNGVMEVTRDSRELYSHNPTANLGFPLIYGAQKLRNGHIVCISGQGMLLEMDTAGKRVKTVQLTNNGGWCSVEGLPGGRLLVALTNHGRVLEIDAAGKTLWQCTVPGASHATRLPNGNTLVASMLNRRVVEVDGAGKVVWEQSTSGRPFHVHRR